MQEVQKIKKGHPERYPILPDRISPNIFQDPFRKYISGVDGTVHFMNLVAVIPKVNRSRKLSFFSTWLRLPQLSPLVYRNRRRIGHIPGLHHGTHLPAHHNHVDILAGKHRDDFIISLLQVFGRPQIFFPHHGFSS